MVLAGRDLIPSRFAFVFGGNVLEEIEESDLIALTRRDQSVAVAEFLDGLGARVFAGGGELGPWSGPKVAEIVGANFNIGGPVTTHTKAVYYLLHWNKDTEELKPFRGPLTASELRDASSDARGASA